MISQNVFECPESHAKWYCLNGATCFSVRIGESFLHNCWCPSGFHGPRCNFKYTERRDGSAGVGSTAAATTAASVPQTTTTTNNGGPSETHLVEAARLRTKTARLPSLTSASAAVAALTNNGRQHSSAEHQQRQLKLQLPLQPLPDQLILAPDRSLLRSLPPRGTPAGSSDGGYSSLPLRHLSSTGLNAVLALLAVTAIVVILHYAYSSFVQNRRRQQPAVQRLSQQSKSYRIQQRSPVTQLQRLSAEAPQLSLYPFADQQQTTIAKAWPKLQQVHNQVPQRQLHVLRVPQLDCSSTSAASTIATTTNGSSYQWIDEPSSSVLSSRAPSVATTHCSQFDWKSGVQLSGENLEVGAVGSSCIRMQPLELEPFEYVRYVRSHLQFVAPD